MLSRIFWVGLAGLALIGGMYLQDGDRMFLGWTGHDQVSERTERAIEERIERAVEGSIDRMEVVAEDGREIAVPKETRRALGDAVGRLIEAEAALAVLKIRDGSGEELAAAAARRDQARVEVESLKGQIEAQEAMSRGERDIIRQQVRSEIRAAVREAVGN